MKKIMTIFLMVIVGCATTMPDGGVYRSTAYQFSVQIPTGWRKLDTNKYFLITRDDPFLQYALIQRRPLERPFKHTQKKLKMAMLPQEAANVIIDEIASDRRILNFKVIENIPATIDGHDGFKILFLYKDRQGVPYKTLYYGFITGNSFYNIRYTAAMQEYFEKDIPTFEQILESFKLHDATAA